MKRKILFLLALVVAVSAPMVPRSEAVDLSISVGDRPYYHGANYWHEGYRWVWVPGHWRSGHRWVPGHYVKRGGYNSYYARRHFRHHRVYINNNWR